MVPMSRIHHVSYTSRTTMTDSTPAFDTFIRGLIKEPLTTELLDTAIMALEGWQRDSTEGIDCLAATFSFEDFNACMTFTERIAVLADEYDHHPELVIRYGKVTVRWWTHTAGGIAANDVFMATQTSQLTT